jgi:hypothetical protein
MGNNLHTCGVPGSGFWVQRLQSMNTDQKLKSGYHPLFLSNIDMAAKRHKNKISGLLVSMGYNL